MLGQPPPAGGNQDRTFSPDLALDDGDRLECAGFSVRAIHTPGHASNHLCFLREADGLLFTGDHIINGSTVVIDPPDGNMAQYLASLARLKQEDVRCIAPGHGDLLHEPHAAVDWLIRHRLEREEKVAAALAAHPGKSLADLTAVVYAEVDKHLHPVAARSLLAHLGKLQEDGRATLDGDAWYPREA